MRKFVANSNFLGGTGVKLILSLLEMTAIKPYFAEDAECVL